MVKNYLKVALRNIQKHKGYAIINIMGLSVGMAIALLTMIWIQYELSFDTFHENADRLYQVAFSTDRRIQFADTFHGTVLPGLAADYLADKYPEIEAATIVGRTNNKLSVDKENFFGTGKFVHPSFFTMFTFPFIAGDSQTAFSTPLSMVITESLGKRLFGDADPLGRTIKVADRFDIEVTGILKDLPKNSHFQFDFLFSFLMAPEYMKMWDNKAVEIFVLLEKNSTWKDVSEKIINVYNDHNPGSYPNYFYLNPINRIRLYNLDGGGRIQYIYIFSALALAMLLVACINFMNLSTACSSIRFKEIGIKKVLGSSRFGLIKQFLGESIILSFISLIGSVAIMLLLLPMVNTILGEQLKLQPSPVFVLGILGIPLLTGFLSGGYPSFVLSAFKPIRILRGRAQSHSDSRSPVLRKLLVVGQFTVSIIFIISVFIIYLQLHFFKNKDLGFERDNVVVLRLTGDAIRQIETIKTELSKLTNVLNASMSEYGLTGWNSSAGIGWPGKREDQIFDVGRNSVDEDYLATYQLKMVQGRFFSREHPSDATTACIVNETAIKAMELDDPLGKEIIWSHDSAYERRCTLIGVIKDYHTESLHGAIRPFILFPTSRGSLLSIRIQPENIRSTLKAMEETVHSIAPNYVFNYSFLNWQLEALYQEEALTGQFIVYMSLIAIFIACLGLFGLASFAAERRIKEIGIRKVMGASVGHIITMISKEFVGLILLSNLVAWPVAYFAMNQWLQRFAFHIDLQFWIFLCAGLIILCLGILTVSFRTLKAAMANPVEALHYE